MIKIKELGNALPTPSNLPCNNINGGMVDVLFFTLQIDGDPHIILYQTKTILEFPMFNVCENASHIYDANVAFSYFSLIEITIFHHILLGNNNASGCNLCMCINVLLAFIKKQFVKRKNYVQKKRKIILLRF
jgi:hypothetical protein